MTQPRMGEPVPRKGPAHEEHNRQSGRQGRHEIPLADQGTGLRRVPAHEGHVDAIGKKAVGVHIAGDQRQANGQPPLSPCIR